MTRCGSPGVVDVEYEIADENSDAIVVVGIGSRNDLLVANLFVEDLPGVVTLCPLICCNV